MRGVLSVGETNRGVIPGLVLLMGLGIFLYHVVQAIPASVPLDYGEGPLLNQARLLAEGRPIYRPNLNDYPYTVANYPPLYPLAVSIVGRLLGFSYATGRVVSILATLGCGLAVGLIVLQLTGERAAAAVSSALFFSFPYVVHWGSLGRVDMLALAFSLWGIWAALRWPDSTAGLGLSVLLLGAAVFTRQSYLLAAPLAMVVHLALRDWRRALLFALALGALVLGVGGIFTWRTQGGFFFHVIVANVNAFDLSYALTECLETVALAAPLIVVILWGFLYCSRHPEQWPWPGVAYFVGGFASGLTIGKVGSNVNYLLEWVTAMSVLGGITLAHREVSRTLRCLLFLTLVFQILWSLWLGWGFVTYIQNRRAVEPEVRQLEAIVRSTSGPVLADEMMSLLVVCGREILFQPFEFTQLALEGKWDQGRFVADIRAGKFALILVTEEVGAVKERWTPEMWAAIRERYEPVTILANTVVYRPRISEESP